MCVTVSILYIYIIIHVHIIYSMYICSAILDEKHPTDDKDLTCSHRLLLLDVQCCHQFTHCLQCKINLLRSLEILQVSQVL